MAHHDAGEGWRGGIGGQVIALVSETPAVLHKIMVPPNLSGTITEAKPNGNYKIHDVIAVLTDEAGEAHELTLGQSWPIRTPRPYENRPEHFHAPYHGPAHY